MELPYELTSTAVRGGGYDGAVYVGTSSEALMRLPGRLVALVATVLLAGGLRAGAAVGPPTWLPRYDLEMDLDIDGHVAHVLMAATWTNPHPAPTDRLVFNAHSRYVVPRSQMGLSAKTLEVLRLAPSDALGIKEPALEVHTVRLGGFSTAPPPAEPVKIDFFYEGDTKTTLVVPLPRPVGPGESVRVFVDMSLRLPPKMGRWGQWRDVTYLSNWLPVFAFYGEHPPPPPPMPGAPPVLPKPPEPPGWQPTPFVPWHQPFFNEAAWYRVHVTLPADQKVACTGTIRECIELPGHKKRLVIDGLPGRDFAFLCSARYQEHVGEVEVQPGRPPVRIHVLALPEHDWYGKEIVGIVQTALAAYSAWFGPYPYEDFTIAEAFFGWNGNECSGLVMIDERIFGMPHLAKAYVQQLVSHEICHQWWYNLIGTNGYCETWMDEGLATYLSHRLMDQTCGRDNNLMEYPNALKWLPNIRRKDYRNYGLCGTLGRGENSPVVQEMTKFGHVFNLFSMCYDKGSRIVGMIEERLGEQSFLDFMRLIYRKYQYRILRVADFQRELEAYTGPARDWPGFFAQWIYGPGLSDWAVAKVELTPPPLCRLAHGKAAAGTRAKVRLEQRGAVSEQTVLGFALPDKEGYPIRVPIVPQAISYDWDNPPAHITTEGPNVVVVDLELPDAPDQITVDPDQVLVDKNPLNNFWRPHVRWRWTPVYTFLEETDITCAYDAWNVIAGPWVYGQAWYDAWYTRSTTFGARLGVYRTQDFNGGVYGAYRTDVRDVVAGADGLIDHWPDSHFQVGFNVEHRLAEFYAGNHNATRGVLYGRYVDKYASSLYLPPMEYVEGYVDYQDNFLPFVRDPEPGGQRPDHMKSVGMHYRKNYLTPYWNPEAGFQLDLWADGGVAAMPQDVGMAKMAGQFSYVDRLPDFSASLPEGSILAPLLRWLGDSRLATRIYGGTSVPGRGEFLTMGGGPMFRGFDLAQRQGSSVWVGSVEWRMPLATGLTWDFCDHTMGLRNIYGAVFWDVGDAYLQGHQVAPIAHDVGGGLRLDVIWFGFVERTTLRLDVAKAINTATPWQVWVGVGMPF